MLNGHGGARPGAGRPRKIIAPANRETLTEDQTNILKASQYVSSIQNHQVSYTLTFKELFWQRFMDGVPPIQIFRDAGIDPDMLGENRINGFVTTLRKQYEGGEAFKDGRHWKKKKHDDPRYEIPKPPRLPPRSSGRYSDTDIARLTHQVAYMSQEMEFLKKIILAENGGKSE